MATKTAPALPVHPGAKDETDRQLIALLQANARESTANIARKLGIARTTVVARIARLEAAGVLVGYTARLGSEAQGRGVQAFVTGLAPLTVGLVLSTGFILGKPGYGNPWLLATMVVTIAICVRTKVSPLWLIAAGGLVGAFLG